MLEKIRYVLVWATQRLRHCILNFTSQLVSLMDPLKYLFKKPTLTGQIAKWQLLLAEFDIIHVTQKAIESQERADQFSNKPSRITNQRCHSSR